VPAVPLGPAPQEVRAFRVDVSDDAFGVMDVEEHDRYVMTEMTARFGDWLCPQGKVAVDYGWEMIGVLSYGQHTHHTVLVRLYRPGYKTVEVESWQLPPYADWQKAASPADQERAVDDLLSTYERDDLVTWSRRREASSRGEIAAPPRDPSVFRNLAPGSAGRGHREALLFAAAEYERLAKAAEGDAGRDVRTRSAEKAAALRKLADQ
jgi:hypothetical protein